MSDDEADHGMRLNKKKRGRPKMYDDSRFVEPDPNPKQRGIPRPDRRNQPRHGHGHGGGHGHGHTNGNDESEQEGSSSDDSAAGGRLPRLFKRSASKEESGDEPDGVNHQGMKRAKAEKKKGKKGRDPMELPGPLIDLHPDMAAVQHKLVIGGVDIYFPVDPYLEQVKYMTSIIEALNTGKNALLESPTGTGKSLSLLAATLGWLKKQREDALANPNSGAPKTTIVYTSRTHSQLNQVVNEMKTLCYLASMTLVGSRDYLCIHEKVRDVTERWKRDLMCKNECQTGGCPYRQTRGANGFFYKNGRRMNNDNDDNGPGPKGMKIEDFATEFAERKVICDIEDFAIVGRRNQVCPYYVSKKLMTEADIVFLPYNYLTNVNIASNYEMILKNSILIFDEAHNVEKTSEEGTTFDMELYDLNLIMEKLNHMAASKNNEMTSLIKPKKNDRRSSKMPEFSQNQIVFMMGVVAYLQRLFAKAKTTMTEERAGNASSGQSEKQEIVFDFENCFRFIFNIPEEETGSLLDILPPLQPYDKNQENIKSQFDNKLDIPLKPQNLLTFIQNLYLLIKREFLLDTSDQETGMNVSMEKVFQFMDFFAVIYDNYHQNARIMDFTDLFCNHFRMSFILRNSAEMATQPLKIRIWSLSPFYTFQRIKSLEPRCILLTSGTLSPMESYEKMLKTKFEVKINCNHVIDSKQQLFVAMPKFTRKPAEGGLEINLDYKSRKNDELVTQIGEAVYKLIKSVPSGVLIFCTSYSVLANYCMIWKKAKAPGTHATATQPGFKSLYHAINEAKVICTEEKCPDRQTANLTKFMQNFRKGAIFFAVCEGKLSEGINFKDDMARMVIILGTPYANYTDIRVMQKWSYLDNMRSKVSAEEKSDCLAGHEWYEQNAMRSLNQSVGRIIRHRQDYGAIIFFDSRLINHNLQRKISGWIRERLVVHESVDDVVKQIVTFFAQIEAKKTRLTQRIQNGESEAILFEDTSKLLSSVIKQEVLGMGAEESERIIAEHIKTNDQQLNIPQYDEPVKTPLPPPTPRPITPVKTAAEEEAAKKKWEQAVQKSKVLVPATPEPAQPAREFKASTSTSTEVKPRPHKVTNQASISQFTAPKPQQQVSSSFTARPPAHKETAPADGPSTQRVKLNAQLRVTGRELTEDDLMQVGGSAIEKEPHLYPESQLDDILDEVPTPQPFPGKQPIAHDRASGLFGQAQSRIGQTSKKRQATKPAKPRSNSRPKQSLGLPASNPTRVEGDGNAGHNSQRDNATGLPPPQSISPRAQGPPQSSLQLPPTGYTKNLFSFKFKQEPAPTMGSGVNPAPPRHSPPPAVTDSEVQHPNTQAVTAQTGSSHTPTLTMLWGGKQQAGDKPTFHTPRNVLADNVKKHAANH